jgi:hypothetical protein
MIGGSRRLAAGFALLVSIVAPGSAVATPAALAPHRAIYDLSLVNSRGGTGISELSGRMVYELTGSPCEGFSQSMRFVTRSTNQEGTASISDIRSSTWEEANGDRFRFNSTQYRNDQITEQTQGEATRRKNPREVRVELTRPKKKIHKIGGDAMFPVQHSMNLLQAARDGRTNFTTDLFDASEKGEKVYSTSAFIGRRLEPGYNASLPDVTGASNLNGLTAWPIALSYYDLGKEKQDTVPEYELAFVIFDNGVSRRIRIDYGDFSIRGDLKELILLDAGKCDATKK